MWRLAFLLPCAATILFAQGPSLDLVVREAAAIRNLPENENYSEELKTIRSASVGFHTALRDWIEAQLPASKENLDAELALLHDRISAELTRVGLDGPEDNSKSGYVSGIDFSHPVEAPDFLVVIAGVSVPCGRDDVIYIYDYSGGATRRVLASHGSRDFDQRVSMVKFSKPDASGNRSILTFRFSAQCASFWQWLTFDLFRYSAASGNASPIFTGEHDIYIGEDYPVRLEPNEFFVQLGARSIDTGLLIRTHVLHYRLDESSAERIDPVALQPQDFVDEWLTRPWAEMESRSGESDRDKLQKWHDFLAGKSIYGEYAVVQACEQTPGQSQIGVNFDWLKGEELPEPLSVSFLVQQTEKYHFQMIGISFNPYEDCPGDGEPSQERPSLFPKVAK